MKSFKKFFYINTKAGVNADQSWKEQQEQIKTNEVYELVNFVGGGTLIEVYNEGGDKEPMETKKTRILDYAENVLKPQYFYKEGDVILDTIITEDMAKRYSAKKRLISHKFLKYKAQQDVVVELPEDDALQRKFPSMVSLDSIIPPYEEHKACWDLYRRGAVGETPLLLLFLNNTPKHLRIASYLLEKYPSLALDFYEGADYYGETCLHFAVIQNDINSIKMLINTGKVDMNARARGKFFMPTDVKRGTVRLHHHKYSGFAYYGEYPLSFAASIGNVDVYDLLLENGSFVGNKDRFGNTVLHLAVVHNQIDMFRHALFNAEIKADLHSKNNEGLTPIALAAKLGRLEMTKAILDMTGRQFWSFSNMVCVAYPLVHMDSIDKTGETNWKSTLMQIIEGNTNNHLDMLEIGAINRLLNEKWKTFARDKFLRLLLYQIIHLVFLTCAVYLRPFNRTELLGSTNPQSLARYVFEILTIAFCVVPLFFGIIEIRIETMSGFWKNIRSIPSRLLYYIGCLLLILCIPFRLTKLYLVEEWLLVFGIPFIWSYMLFFARGWNVTGPFVTMIYRMLYTDIARFAFIYLVILLTSGLAFYYQYEGQNVEEFLTGHGTFMTLFQMSLGEFNYDAIKNGKYPAVTRILFIVYMLLVHVLLLNMLIAMMTGTYEEVAEQTRKEWRRQWASMTIILERSHSNDDRLIIQGKYSENLAAERMTQSGDPTNQDDAKHLQYENRALLLVKVTETSISKKKKEVKNRWKKMGKEAAKQNKESGKVKEKPKKSARLTIQGVSGIQSWMSGVLTKDIGKVAPEIE